MRLLFRYSICKQKYHPKKGSSCWVVKTSGDFLFVCKYNH